MPTKQLTPSQFKNQVEELPEDLKAYVRRLEQDSHYFHYIFTDDPGDDVELVSLLGQSLILLLSQEVIAYHKHNKQIQDTLFGFLHRLGESMYYRILPVKNH